MIETTVSWVNARLAARPVDEEPEPRPKVELDQSWKRTKSIRLSDPQRWGQGLCPRDFARRPDERTTAEAYKSRLRSVMIDAEADVGRMHRGEVPTRPNNIVPVMRIPTAAQTRLCRTADNLEMEADKFHRCKRKADACRAAAESLRLIAYGTEDELRTTLARLVNDPKTATLAMSAVVEHIEQRGSTVHPLAVMAAE